MVCGDLRRVGQPGNQEGSRLADEFGGGYGLDRGAFEGVTGIVAVGASVGWGCVMMSLIVVMIVAVKGDFQSGLLKRAVQGRRQPEGQESESNEAAETKHGQTKRGNGSVSRDGAHGGSQEAGRCQSRFANLSSYS